VALLARLVLLQKPDGTPRPIGVGNIIARVVHSAMLGTRRAEVNRALPSCQLGVGVEDGTIAIARWARCEWARGRVCAALDARNAFGSIDRKAVARALAERIPAWLGL